MNEQPNTDDIFEALAHETRRSIVLYVAQCPRSISSLGTELGYSLPAIHKHIDILENAHMIQRRKEGRVNYLSIKRSGLVKAQKWLGQFHSYYGNDQESLQNYSEAIKKENI